jgi:hypothetical protein
MKKRISGIVTAVVIICAVIVIAIYSQIGLSQAPQTPTQSLDITVSGSSNCLRFLNDSVPMVYVPFTVAANQQMQLTINATKMPGGVNGWTDIYLYKGHWDKGTNNTCKSGDVYAILGNIEATNSVVMLNSQYMATFRGTTQQSYTVFFVFPPGGQAQFHITLKST